MDLYMAYDASEVVYEYVQNVKDRGLFGQKYVQEVKTTEQLIAEQLTTEYHQKDSITLYNLKNFEDPLTRNKFKRSDMDIYMAYEASEGVYEYVQKAQDRGVFGQKYFLEVKRGPLNS